MAIGRLSVSIGKKGKASPHAMYIAREGKYAKPDDDLEKLEFVGSGNMPRWAEKEPSYFWLMADKHERKNGSTYREHVIALPRELKPYQRHELIKDWIEQEIGDKHAYQYAIHNPQAMDGKEQPHCHLMFSERTRDGIERDPDQYFKRYNSKNPERGGAKKANTGMKPADRKADLLAQRERWEQTCNKHLEQAGSRATISMKSNKDRGLGTAPFNVPMRVFNRPDVKEIYVEKLQSEREYARAIRQSNLINIPQEIDRLGAAEQLRQEQERQAELERQEQLRQEQERQAELERQEQLRQGQERQAELERQEQLRQEQERQAELERQEQLRQEQERQAELERQEQLRQEQERQAELERQEQLRQEQERQAELERQEQLRQEQERQAELERQEQLRQEQERQAELERQEQLRQEQERQAELERQEQLRQAARKLSTPVEMPSIRNLGGNRFKEAFEDVHQYHDVLADKLDKRQIRSNKEAVSQSDYFYLCVQSACYELGNAMARRPDQNDIDKYETAYKAVDKLMGSIEQRMEDVRLTAVTGEHEKATRQLNNVRQSIDIHSARIDAPIQQQPTPSHTYRPR